MGRGKARSAEPTPREQGFLLPYDWGIPFRRYAPIHGRLGHTAEGDEGDERRLKRRIERRLRSRAKWRWIEVGKLRMIEETCCGNAAVSEKRNVKKEDLERFRSR